MLLGHCCPVEGGKWWALLASHWAQAWALQRRQSLCLLLLQNQLNRPPQAMFFLHFITRGFYYKRLTNRLWKCIFRRAKDAAQWTSACLNKRPKINKHLEIFNLVSWPTDISHKHNSILQLVRCMCLTFFRLCLCHLIFFLHIQPDRSTINIRPQLPRIKITDPVT